MLKRIGSMAFAVLAAVLPHAAGAASFGTSSWGQLTPYGDLPDAHVSDVLTDVRPTTTSAWIADGGSSATALTPFGSNHAAVQTVAGVSAYAASLWSETFTITSTLGATGPAYAGFHMSFAGSLDAGPNLGGWAQVALHALVGSDTSGEIGLAPSVVFGSAVTELSESCGLGGDDLPSAGCAPDVLGTNGLLDLGTTFSYGTPFRFDVLLEALARNGGHADFAPSGWLAQIDLPPGAEIGAASLWDYSDLVATVPEPGTALLCALGLAGLATRRKRS
jgi:hypothetical protein